MATPANRITGINSEWLARDNKRYIVRIPTPGGSGNFNFADYGGTVGALQAAKKFQRAMLKQYEFDKQYHKDHGEFIERVHLNVNNKSGIPGVCRMVYPRGYQNPLIAWVAYWQGKHVRFSCADPNIKNEQDAKQKAIAWRREKETDKFK